MALKAWAVLQPCALCLKQRETHWIAASAALAWIAALKFAPGPGLEKLAFFGIGAAFLLCFGVAAYHVAVENHWVLAQCDADLGAIRPLGEESHFDAPRCDVIAWSLFGISMAGYNAILSGIAAIVSFVLIRQPEAKL